MCHLRKFNLYLLSSVRKCAHHAIRFGLHLFLASGCTIIYLFGWIFMRLHLRIGLRHFEWTCEEGGCIWSSFHGITRFGCISMGWDTLWCIDRSCGTCWYWKDSGISTFRTSLIVLLSNCMYLTFYRCLHSWESAEETWYLLQFCLLLSVLAAMPEELGGLGGSVIYIDTEKKFRSGRYFLYLSGNGFRIKQLTYLVPEVLNLERALICHWIVESCMISCVFLCYHIDSVIGSCG